MAIKIYWNTRGEDVENRPKNVASPSRICTTNKTASHEKFPHQYYMSSSGAPFSLVSHPSEMFLPALPQRD